jgi:hypothetical protein
MARGGRGKDGEAHRWRVLAAGLVNHAGNEGDRRRQLKLVGAALRHRRDGAEGGDGRDVKW